MVGNNYYFDKKKRGGNIAQSINRRVPNVWVNGSSLEFEF